MWTALVLCAVLSTGSALPPRPPGRAAPVPDRPPTPVVLPENPPVELLNNLDNSPAVLAEIPSADLPENQPSAGSARPPRPPGYAVPLPYIPSVDLPDNLPENPPVELPDNLPVNPPVELPENPPVELPENLPVELPDNLPENPPVELPDNQSGYPPLVLRTDLPEIPPTDLPDSSLDIKLTASKDEAIRDINGDFSEPAGGTNEEYQRLFTKLIEITRFSFLDAELYFKTSYNRYVAELFDVLQEFARLIISDERERESFLAVLELQRYIALTQPLGGPIIPVL